MTKRKKVGPPRRNGDAELSPNEHNLAQVMSLAGTTIDDVIRDLAAEGMGEPSMVAALEERFGVRTSRTTVRQLVAKIGGAS